MLPLSMFKNKLLERKLLKANTHYTNVDSYENQIGRKEKKRKEGVHLFSHTPAFPCTPLASASAQLLPCVRFVKIKGLIISHFDILCKIKHTALLSSWSSFPPFAVSYPLPASIHSNSRPINFTIQQIRNLTS